MNELKMTAQETLSLLMALHDVNNMLADMHDSDVDKNYPEEKCLACMCQEELVDLQRFIYTKVRR